MVALLTRWIVLTVAVLLSGTIIKGITVESPLKAFLAAVVLSLLNAILRPVLIFLTLPINILTLGLFILVINAFLLWLTSVILRGGLVIHGIVPAILGALFISVVSGLLNWLVRSGEKKRP
ncbi:MAG: phage holin family protein [Candidatus Eisenbacteria bacterium]|nr:phage holin family protein [Candidatus Eisenbacteria bacterium]